MSSENGLRKGYAAAKRFSQRLFDAAFANFDEALREMGVGDLSVGKKIRKMAEAFYGRIGAYEVALAADAPAAFDEALVRNVYRGAQPTADQIKALSQSLSAFQTLVASTPLDELLRGSLGQASASA